MMKSGDRTAKKILAARRSDLLVFGDMSSKFPSISAGLLLLGKWVCLKMGYTPNEIAIFHRDNDH